MPSTYTSLLRLTLPADGELIGTWGQVVNNGITTLAETAIAGTTVVTMVDANYTLSTANGATDEARNMVVQLTGTNTAQRDLIVPNASKIYFVRNNTVGGFGVQVKTAAGTGVVVPNGTAMLVYCNGSVVVAAITTVVGTGQSLIDDGTAALPGLAFTNDPNTGLYRISADTLGFSTAGTLRLTINSNGTLDIATPTSSAPALTMIAASAGLGVDIRGRSADGRAEIRLLNNTYSVANATFSCFDTAGYVGTQANIAFTILTNNTSRLAFTAAGIASFSNNVSVATQLASPNLYVGETASAAGTVGISSSVGASTIYWGNSAAGAGRYDMYTGSGPALILPRVASSVNYFTMNQSATGFGPELKVTGSDTNVQFNYYTQGAGIHAFWASSAAQFVIQPVASAAYFMLTGGAVAGANPYFAISGSNGIRFSNCGWQAIGAGRPWSGSIAESQSFAYNVSLGICNATSSADNRIHEWYKDSTAFYGLWISDNAGAAAQWVKATGGYAAGTTAIDFNTTGSLTVTATAGLKVISNNVLDGITITDAGANGAHIKFVSSALSTPNKYLRAQGASFELVNHAYTFVMFAVNETTGAITNKDAIEMGFRGSPMNGYTGASTLLVADRGKTHYKTDATQVTIPASTFTIGDVVVILNWSGSNMSIVSGGGMTVYKGGTASTATPKTLLGVGMATVLFESASTAVISGNLS